MAFYHPEDPYEEDCAPECYECSSRQSTIDLAADNLISLMNHLYTGESFYSEEFEDNLRDLCKKLDVNFPNKDLKITGKE